MIFVSDYDATLFNNDTVTQEDLDAIDLFRSKGYQFGIITGRPIDSILHEINKYNIPYDFLAGVNGGVVLTKDLEPLHREALPLSITMEIMDILDREEVMVYGVNDCYRTARIYVKDEVESQKPSGEESDVASILEAGVGSIYVWTESLEDARVLATKINSMYLDKGIRAYTNREAVDIGYLGTSKSRAISHYIDHFGWDSEIFVMGDGYNDLPMIGDYFGIAIAHAEDEVILRAKRVEESVASAIATILKDE